MYGCLMTLRGCFFKSQEWKAQLSHLQCPVFLCTQVPILSMVLTIIAIANECRRPCLLATSTNSSILHSCVWCITPRVAGVYMALAGRGFPCAKLATIDLKCQLATVLHRALRGCSTEPDEMYRCILCKTNTVTSVDQLACKIKHSVCNSVYLRI